MLLSVLKDVFGNSGGRNARESTGNALPSRRIEGLQYARNGKIIAFVGMSEGDALRQQMLELLAPFRALCSDIAIIDLNHPNWILSLEDAVQYPIWFAISSFGIGEILVYGENDADNPWLEAGIPFVRIYGDTPAYFPARHIQKAPNSINVYGHAEHFDEFQRWFAPVAPSLMLHLFPIDLIDRHRVAAGKKIADGQIVFPKNGNCPDRLISYWRGQLPPKMATLLECLAETLGADLDQPVNLMSAVEDALAQLGVALPKHDRLRYFLVAQLDDYLRRQKSLMIAKSLLDYPVVIRGVNWDHLDFSGARATYDPDSDYGRTREVIDGSLAIMDMSPNTHYGAHDRVLRSAGRYTAFLTNRQQFFVDNFSGHEDFTFQFNPDAIRQRVEWVLAHRSETVDIGLAQAERMRELFPRERFVEQLVTVVDACALACGQRPIGTQDFVAFNVLR